MPDSVTLCQKMGIFIVCHSVFKTHSIFQYNHLERCIARAVGMVCVSSVLLRKT